MRTLRRWWSRLAGTVIGHRREDRLAEELESHVQMLVEENLAHGMSEEKARREARLTFGGVESAKDWYRDQRGLPWLDTIARDVRYAGRGMRRNPGFTAVAVACLALGIGANTTVFSLINAAMIRPLPVDHPEQLVVFRVAYDARPGPVPRSSSGMGDLSLPYAALGAFGARARTLSGVFAFVRLGFDNASVTVAAARRSGVGAGEMVSGGYFRVLGVPAVLGRPIVESDLRDGVPNVTVLSHAYWRREFGGDPAVVGRAVTLNGLPFTVVGVAPAGFLGVDPSATPDLWVPLKEYSTLRPWGLARSDGPSLFEDTGYFWCTTVGRLREDVTLEHARAELEPIFRHAITDGLTPVPPAEVLPHLVLEPADRGLDNLRGRLSTPLQVVAGGALLVLLIACANMATLLLARSESRQREIGVRLAVGASRVRVVQQLLTEGVVLAALGGAIGLLVALWSSRALILLLARGDQAVSLDTSPDLVVFAFSAAISLLTGVVFALAPAWRAARADVASRLKRETRAVSARPTLGRVLIVGQVALSVLLLFTAGLFVRTLHGLRSQDLGFNSGNLLLFQLDTRRAGYEGERATAAYSQAIERVRVLPGVRSASASAQALLSGWNSTSSVSTDGPPLPPGHLDHAYWNAVGPDFIETMGIRVVLGRGLGRSEFRSSRRVAVVNQAWARAFFPGESPIGRHFCLGRRLDADRLFEIVGVVENAKYDRIRLEPPATAYVPYTSSAVPPGRMWITVRTVGSPLAIVGPIREALRALDVNLPPVNVRTQHEQIDRTLAQERMFATVSSTFGLVALVLVAIGLFGTLAYAVSRRTSEIGIRMALGAGAPRVWWMVLKEALALMAAGMVIGLPAAFTASRLVKAQLFGVTTYDGWTVVATVAILLAAGGLAGYLPARRAAKVDPIRALRAE